MKKTFHVIKLCNLSPFHVGDGREDCFDFSAGFFTSDGIASALASVLASRGEGQRIEPFMQRLRISSAFPFAEGKYFLPVPQGFRGYTMQDTDIVSARKQLKKIFFVEHTLWQEIAQTGTTSIAESDIHGSFLCRIDEWQQPYESRVVQRVQVSRDEAEPARPFFFEWTYFRQGAGLYFLLDADEELFEETTSLFADLSDRGIGSDRAAGGGHFDVSTDSLSLDLPDAASHQMLLSRFIPTKPDIDSIDLQSSSYSLVRCGGYMAGSEDEDLRNMRRREVYMFTAGSVLCSEKPLEGKLVDLSPVEMVDVKHPVFRSGLPIVIPIKQAEK